MSLSNDYCQNMWEMSVCTRNLMFPDKSYFQNYFLLVPENLAQCPMCFESAGMVWSLTSSASLMQSRYLVNCASQQSFSENKVPWLGLWVGSNRK